MMFSPVQGLDRSAADPSVAESATGKRTTLTDAVEANTHHAQRLEALGNLASGMAHDFGNELQVISGAIAMLTDPDEPDGLRRGIDILNEVVERAGSVVRRLLSYAREDVLDTTRIEVGKLLVGMQEVLRHTLPRQIEVRVQVTGPEPFHTWADKSQLQTVILNLANNARHAMPSGGVLTLAASFDRDVVLTAGGLPLEPADYVRIDVADTGCGMSRSTLARASEPFFTTRQPGTGTGLGLAMARGFAEQSGGALSIISALGHGSLISIWLPLAPPVEEAAQTDAPTRGQEPGPSADRGPVRAILVDDVQAVSEVLARQLTRAGIEVRVVGRSTDVAAIMRGPDPIDLMITDFAMPDLTGDELIRQTHLLRPSLPVILLTGHPYECEGFLRNYKERQLVTLMTKPVSRLDMVRAIELSLAETHGRRGIVAVGPG